MLIPAPAHAPARSTRAHLLALGADRRRLRVINDYRDWLGSAEFMDELESGRSCRELVLLQLRIVVNRDFYASRTSQIAQVGKRKIEVSNLTKLLFPDERNQQSAAHRILSQDRADDSGTRERAAAVSSALSGRHRRRVVSLTKNRPDWAPRMDRTCDAW